MPSTSKSSQQTTDASACYRSAVSTDLSLPVRLLLCLVGGLLITPALAPLEWSWLAPASPALLYLGTRGLSPKKAAGLGWLFGCSFFGGGVSWVFVSIHEHSDTPLPVAILLTLLFVMALALLFALQTGIWRRWFSTRLEIIGFIGTWLLFEWLRSWLLTGFPWLYLGYATLDTPLTGWIPVGGVWLGSLGVLLCGLGLVTAWIRRQPAWLVLSLLPFTAMVLPSQWTQPVDKPLSVALVQPNIPQAEKWRPENLSWILQRYMDLSADQLDRQLLIWPETAIPAFFSKAVRPLAPFLDQLDRHSVGLISGMPTLSQDPDAPRGYRMHNSLVILSDSGGAYHKQRLVPFGEYVPLENWLRGLLDFFNLPMSSFSLPLHDQPDPLRVSGYALSPAICYEIAYPELVRQLTRQADILLTVSNDTWFGHSIAPAQHLQIARMRALENGRWLMRGTNNGITALVSPVGRVTDQLPRFETGVLRGEVYRMQGQTPFQQLGSWPVLLLTLLMLLTAGLWRGQSASDKR